MATRYWRRKAILAKIEATYGTDPVPTNVANAIEARNVSFTPLKNKMVDNNVERTYIGHAQQIRVGAEASLQFDVAAVGSGTAGTAPAYGPLLRACGRAETISAGTSVAYAPVSSAYESATLYFNMDGVQHKLLGARGDVDFKLNNGGIPVFTFKFTGLYGGISDVALPALTMTPWKTPVAANNANTSAFTLHGYAGLLYGLDIASGQTVIHRDDIVGVEDVQITDRKMTGSLSIAAPLIAEKDYFTIANANTLGALSITHGTVAGYKVKLDAPAVQLLDPSYEDKNGMVALKMNLAFIPVSGNDELVITAL